MDRDLLPPEIEEKFLEFVDKFHAKHNYERDFRILARKLDIIVSDGQKDQYFTTSDEQPYIVIDISNPKNRQRFSGLHELSHHLFEIAEEGELRAYLRASQKPNSEIPINIEERLCDQAAAQMLMPKPIFDEVRNKYGYSPLTVFELAKRTDASLQASLRRLIFAYNLDVQAVIVDFSCRVVDSLSHGIKRGNYNIGVDFIIPSGHSLSNMIKNNSDGIEERFEANVPFKKKPKWKSKVIAVSDCSFSKAIAFFLDNYPSNPSDQLSLELFL